MKIAFSTIQKYRAITCFVLIVVLFSCASCATSSSFSPAGSLRLVDLRCELQTNPLGIDVERPQFSWIAESGERGDRQSAYQILVATSPAGLDQGEADMWNSGEVKSPKSAYVEYSGERLEATTPYYWKVRIWDENGESSQWSDAHVFETGLIQESDWGSSKWVSVDKDTRKSEYRFREYQTGKMDAPIMVTSNPVGYFRHVIETSGSIESARAYICGLGYYELYINGEKTKDHVLDPAPSNYDDQAYYVTYDITQHLKSGKNALGIILGNGFYGQSISWKNDPESERDLSYGIPAVRLKVLVNYKDGSQQEFHTDENWKVSTGPTVFDNVYGGDTYDARYELGAWNMVEYDASGWSEVKIANPKTDELSNQMIPPIRELKEIAPVRVFKAPDGQWIVDFGQNIAGWVEIQVKEKEGQLIDMYMTEALTKDSLDIFFGSTGGGANGLKQNLKYICKGNEVETWSPKFCYYGFQYAKISGLSRKPDANSLKAILVATDINEQGSFTSSEPLFNKMHAISKWTIVDNIHGIPEDCPHREKCGWLGDAHAFCEYALYNYEMGNFYKKYMEDIRTQMRSVRVENDPEKTFMVPTMIAPGKRTSSIAKLDWGIATIYLPWYNYRHYGDSSIVLDYYEDMKGLTNYYLTFKDQKGIIDNGMGDWCPPRWDRKKNPGAMECDPVISANAYFYDALGIMERFATISGDAAYVQAMKSEKDQLYDAFNAAYLQSIEGTDFLWYGSQTATVMALQFEMVPEEKLQQVVDGLVHDIVQVKGGHHATGIHGNRYIYTVLSKYGKADLAYEILTVPTFPSQTYVMNYGFTTWPERQFEWEGMSGLTNSLNHPMHSGFSAYFFESIGGIKSTYEQPGYKLFTVDPTFPQALNSASIVIPTRHGKIQNEWEKDGDKLSMNLTIPFNTSAKLILSDEELKSLNINGKAWRDVGEEVILSGSDVVLGSGNYEIQYIKAKD